MSTLKINNNPLETLKSTAAYSNPLTTLSKTYLTYAKANAHEKVYWYMKAILVIPCVIMVPSIFLMSYTTSNFEWYIGICVLLFYANIIVHIIELKSTIYIPVYHLTILVMLLIPFISYLINS